MIIGTKCLKSIYRQHHGKPYKGMRTEEQRYRLSFIVIPANHKWSIIVS
jgi:hypothetical protein